MAGSLKATALTVYKQA